MFVAAAASYKSLKCCCRCCCCCRWIFFAAHKWCVSCAAIQWQRKIMRKCTKTIDEHKRKFLLFSFFLSLASNDENFNYRSKWQRDKGRRKACPFTISAWKKNSQSKMRYHIFVCSIFLSLWQSLFLTRPIALLSTCVFFSLAPLRRLKHVNVLKGRTKEVPKKSFD